MSEAIETIKKGHPKLRDAVKLLIPYIDKKYIDMLTDGHKSILDSAAKDGYLDIVELALAQGANQNSGVLVVALKNNQMDVFNFLLKDNATNPNQKHDGDTALQCATKRGATELVKNLLARGADPKKEGILNRAIQLEQTDIIDVLLKLDANTIDVNQTGSHQSPLEIATEKWDIKSVEKLLSRPEIDPNAGNEYPLMIAAGKNSTDIARLLISHPKTTPYVEGKTSFGQDRRGDTPLKRASREGHSAMVKVLLADPKFSPKPDDLIDVLHQAIKSEPGESDRSIYITHGRPEILDTLFMDKHIDAEMLAQESPSTILAFAQKCLTSTERAVTNLLAPLPARNTSHIETDSGNKRGAISPFNGATLNGFLSKPDKIAQANLLRNLLSTQIARINHLRSERKDVTKEPFKAPVLNKAVIPGTSHLPTTDSVRYASVNKNPLLQSSSHHPDGNTLKNRSSDWHDVCRTLMSIDVTYQDFIKKIEKN
ncbi:ankyrin repeat domain-containing protein [Glaciimonas sp. GG7]